MKHIVGNWFSRYFSDEQAVLLLFLILFFFGFVLVFGNILAPVFASVVLAFVMQGMVLLLIEKKVPRGAALGIVFTLFMGLLLAFIFLVLPLVWHQSIALLNEVPRMLQQGEGLIERIQAEYPQYISETQLQNWLNSAGAEVGNLGQWLLSFSLASLTNVLVWLIYLILVPIMVFFFLKDKDQMLAWSANFLPHDKPLIQHVWSEMNIQFANYVRGKVMEIIIVGGVSYITFVFMGLNYAALLALLVGLSVIIPYVGAAVVTIPIAIIGAFQWGWSSQFFYLMLAYGVIQALDGNVLVPFLFSEVVNLHPVAIIIAVLFFGGIWGLWGVFFAIPLATFFQTVVKAWPRNESTSIESGTFQQEGQSEQQAD